MKLKFAGLVAVFGWLFLGFGDALLSNGTILDTNALSVEYFGDDGDWYRDNIPFFDCSDQTLKAVYYYRWKLYKAHIRNTGSGQYVITEFINHVAWDRAPYCTINAASMHHIYEGRWLRDPQYVDDYIDYLYEHGGNDRRYSESVADAAWGDYLVHADSAVAVRHLKSMQSIYDGWQDHWEAAKQLYWIPAMPDATEYTIASIDASNGTAGFDHGEAFRPTLNSYQYGNARAISAIAKLNGDDKTAALYADRADALQKTVNTQLWNPALNHYCDRFKQDNQYVHYWDFIRGRELAGMAPWYFDLPPDEWDYGNAWQQVRDTTRLLGQYGLRTNEPSYEYYFKQIIFYQGKPGSQWNGPSWPFQTSIALTGMANLLHGYKHHSITNADYCDLLRRFAEQHYLPDGTLNLVENYDPNRGGPIVHYYWSNHYNHSSFNNLIISGFCGLRPSAGQTLELHPLIDDSISYFCLQDVRYHGHDVTIVFDRDGTRYGKGKGMQAWVDGEKRALKQEGDRFVLSVGKAKTVQRIAARENFALNLDATGYPKATASYAERDSITMQANDGRIWYFKEITNCWTTKGSKAKQDWYAVDFGKTRQVSEAWIYPVADGKTLGLPQDYAIELFDGKWKPAKMVGKPTLKPNTRNKLVFAKQPATAIRLVFTRDKLASGISEIEVYE